MVNFDICTYYSVFFFTFIDVPDLMVLITMFMHDYIPRPTDV